MAYLVRQGVRDQFLDAAAYASTEWGGYAHPIIPVPRRGRVAPIYRQILREIGPDVLVLAGDVEQSVAEDLARPIGSEIVPRSTLEHWSPGLHPLGLIGDAGLSGRTLLVPRRASSVLEVAALGRIYPGQEDDWTTTRATVQPINSDLDLLDGQLDVPSPIGLTHREVGFISHSAWSGGPVMVYTYRASLARAHYFWNLRSLTLFESWPVPPRLVWLPARSLDNPLVWERLRSACMVSNNTPELVLLGRDADALRSLAAAGGFEEVAGTEISSNLGVRRAPRDTSLEPLRFRINLHPAVFLMGERVYGKPTRVPVTVTRPKTMIVADSPVPFTGGGGSIRVEIADVPDLEWPRRPSVAKLFEPNATYKRAGLSVLLPPARKLTLGLSIPDATAVLGALVSERGWAWSISDKGRYSQALIRALGSEFRLLTSRHSLRVAHLLATQPQPSERQGGLGPEPGGPKWLTLKQIASGCQLGRRDLDPVLTDLIGAGLLNRAFRFRCRACGLLTNIPLSRVDDRVVCEGCRETSPLIGEGGSEPSIAYSVNSLFDRVLGQGCLGHVLAAEWARSRIGSLLVIPGAVLTSATDVREVDLLGITRSELVVGEVKESHARFTRREVAAQRRLAHEIGADRLLLASVDEWDRSEREAMARVGRSGTLAMTLLGGDELSDPAASPVEVARADSLNVAP